MNKWCESRYEIEHEAMMRSERMRDLRRQREEAEKTIIALRKEELVRREAAEEYYRSALLFLETKDADVVETIVIPKSDGPLDSLLGTAIDLDYLAMKENGVSGVKKLLAPEIERCTKLQNDELLDSVMDEAEKAKLSVALVLLPGHLAKLEVLKSRLKTEELNALITAFRFMYEKAAKRTRKCRKKLKRDMKELKKTQKEIRKHG